MWEFLKLGLDKLRLLCYLAARLARSALVLLPLVKRIGAMLARWRLWRGKRRRPRITRVWVGPARLDFTYNRRSGFRLVAWARMVTDGGRRRAVVVEEYDLLRKPDPSATQGGAAVAADPSAKRLAKTPMLAAYLTLLAYSDPPSPREPSRLFVSASGGKWHITLKDPTEARQLRVMVDNLDNAEVALEALLTADVCPWEPDLWAQDKKTKKKR